MDAVQSIDRASETDSQSGITSATRDFTDEETATSSHRPTLSQTAPPAGVATMEGNKPTVICARIPSHSMVSGNDLFRTRECEVSVPEELNSVGLCVSHFTVSVEKTCAEIHREMALGRATAEYGVEVATYILESALLLARLISSQGLSDELKKRILCSFPSLMNLRENLNRAQATWSSALLCGGRSVLHWPQAKST